MIQPTQLELDALRYVSVDRNWPISRAYLEALQSLLARLEAARG